MLVDSHCHLTEKRLWGEVDEVLERAREVGVKKVMVAASDVEDGKKVVELVRKFELVDGVVGIHPEAVTREGFEIKKELGLLREMISKNKQWIKGVGEIGLDFYYDRQKKSKQKQVFLFEEQLKIAEEMSWPVVIHMREAEEEVVEVLKRFKEVRGMFHCWSGSEQMLDWAVERGFYVSVAGNVTFKKAERLRNLVKKVNKKRLLIETDAPYLSPEPVRGKLNEPKNVKILASFVAELRKTSERNLIEQTGKNYLCLFG